MITDDIQLMQESRNALRVIQAEKDQQRRSLLDEVKDTLTSSTIAQVLYEVYDDATFEQKAKVDLLFYEQLLQKLDDKYSQQLHEALTSLMGVVKSIYEFINIKPELYGVGIDYDILEASDESIKQRLSSVIYENLDNNFYSLSTEQRSEKYREKSRELSKQLISEGSNPTEAIQFSVKTAVMENLLRKVAFPFSVYTRITTLMESEDYAEIFDQDKLIELVNMFETKIFNLSKIICTVI